MCHTESIRAAVYDAEQARAAAEEARRAKLYSIMACIREVQKRNDSTGRFRNESVHASVTMHACWPLCL